MFLKANYTQVAQNSKRNLVSNDQKTVDFKNNKFAISSWLWFVFVLFLWVFGFILFGW